MEEDQVVDQRVIWAEWLKVARQWKSFITLTYRDDVSELKTKRDVKNLIRSLNIHLLGKNYHNYVVHSYFSYLYSLELTTIGRYHVHMAVDRPIDYGFVHNYWNLSHGFGLIKQANEATVGYIVKYVSKGARVEFHLAKPFYPVKRPGWWIVNDSKS